MPVATVPLRMKTISLPLVGEDGGEGLSPPSRPSPSKGEETIFEAMIVKSPWVGVVILAALLLVL
jgi:hypothetical protein